jgi:hypothetical protein
VEKDEHRKVTEENTKEEEGKRKDIIKRKLKLRTTKRGEEKDTNISILVTSSP